MKTILILEDDLDVGGYWKEHLEDLGHHVIHVTETADAIAAFEAYEVALVITDILIRSSAGAAKPSGGLSLLSHINLNEVLNPKIIAISGAHPQLNVLKHATALNADRTFCKPVDVSELVGVVTELIRESESVPEGKFN